MTTETLERTTAVSDGAQTLHRNPPAGAGTEAAAEAPTPPVGPGAAQAHPHRRKRPPLVALVIAAVIAVIAIVLAVRWFHFNATHVSTDDAQVGGDVYPVNAKVSGYLTVVLPVANQFVHKGDLLVKIDPREYQAAVAQAKGNLDSLKAQAAASGEQVAVTRQTAGAGASGAAAGVNAAQANIGAARAKLETAHAGVNAANAAVHSAIAGEASAQHAIASADAQVRTAVSQRNAALAGLRAAQATRNNVAADANRYALLYHQGAIAQQQYSSALTSLKNADAQVQEAEQAVAESVARINQSQAAAEGARSAAAQAADAVQQARVGQLQAQDQIAQEQAGVGQAQAQYRQSVSSLQGANSAPNQIRVTSSTATSNVAKIAQAQASLDAAKLQLSYCSIYAPADGYITEKSAEPGQLVQPGQSLMAVIPLNATYVDANFKETQMEHLKVGQPAEIQVDAYGGRTFKGTVTSVASATPAVMSLLPAENATGNFVKVVQRIPVRITVEHRPEDADFPLRLGMSVVVTITTAD